MQWASRATANIVSELIRNDFVFDFDAKRASLPNNNVASVGSSRSYFERKRLSCIVIRLRYTK